MSVQLTDVLKTRCLLGGSWRLLLEHRVRKFYPDAHPHRNRTLYRGQDSIFFQSFYLRSHDVTKHLRVSDYLVYFFNLPYHVGS